MKISSELKLVKHKIVLEGYEELRQRTREETSSQSRIDPQWHGSFALMQRLANIEKWKQWDQKEWQFRHTTPFQKWVNRLHMLSWRIARFFKWRIKFYKT